MRKCIMYFPVMTLIAAFIITGCSSDDNGSSVSAGLTEDEIIGTWSLTSVTTDTVETPADHIPSYKLEFALKGEGNFDYQGFDTPFEWSLTDDQITISFWVNTGVVSGNTITYTFNEEDFTIVQVYIKQ